MPPRSRPSLRLAALVLGLLVVVVGARLLGARSQGPGVDDGAVAQAREAGVVNRLIIVNMLDARVLLSIVDVDPDQWGRTPPDDEPPAGLQAAVIDAHRVSGEVWLRPLRIVDGGGDAAFTIDVRLDNAPGSRPSIGRVPTRSTTVEYCGADDRCVDGLGYVDWQDAPDPALDVFRRCVVVDRVIGSYVDGAGVRRAVHAAFQCDATRFQSTLVLFD